MASRQILQKLMLAVVCTWICWALSDGPPAGRLATLPGPHYQSLSTLHLPPSSAGAWLRLRIHAYRQLSHHMLLGVFSDTKVTSASRGPSNGCPSQHASTTESLMLLQPLMLLTCARMPPPPLAGAGVRVPHQPLH